MIKVPTPPGGEPLSAIDDVTVTLDSIAAEELVSSTSILLVDEHTMFTDALSRLFAGEQDLMPVGAVGTVAEAVVECGRLSPDVILVDLRVPDMGGVAGIRSLRWASPSSVVIVVTDRDDAVAVATAIQSGARGFVLKTQAVEELIAIIRQAAAGEIVFSVSDAPTVIGRIRLARQRENEARRTFERLTTRESQILAHLAHGRSTTETATELHISPLTVRSHVKSILAKLGVHSKLEAVSYALRNGLVEADRSA
jgi:DNA-binding NarL/FixJ family response regulator